MCPGQEKNWQVDLYWVATKKKNSTGQLCSAHTSKNFTTTTQKNHPRAFLTTLSDAELCVNYQCKRSAQSLQGHSHQTENNNNKRLCTTRADARAARVRCSCRSTRHHRIIMCKVYGTSARSLGARNNDLMSSYAENNMTRMCRVAHTHTHTHGPKGTRT